MTGNSTEHQRKRLFEALCNRPVSTLDARRELDILHPAARVQELREAGHNIVTHWGEEPTERGEPHRVARYVLMPSTGQ
ncbi:MAG: helix-turn-helix domain-containing protein [Methylomonas sp.]